MHRTGTRCIRKIKYVIEETGEVVKRRDLPTFITKKIIKENVRHTKKSTIIEYTYIVRRVEQLKIKFPEL